MKKEKEVTEIHLKQHDGLGFSLRTIGTPQTIGDAIMSLYAWYITEHIRPEKQHEYLLHTLESLTRKIEKDTIKTIEVDLEGLLEQLGGKK